VSVANETIWIREAGTMRHALIAPLFILAINFCAYAYWIREASVAYTATQNLRVVDDFAEW